MTLYNTQVIDSVATCLGYLAPHLQAHITISSKLQPTNATFSLDLFISTDALHVSGGPSAHHLHPTPWSSISSTVAPSSSTG